MNKTKYLGKEKQIGLVIVGLVIVVALFTLIMTKGLSKDNSPVPDTFFTGPLRPNVFRSVHALASKAVVNVKIATISSNNDFFMLRIYLG